MNFLRTFKLLLLSEIVCGKHNTEEDSRLPSHICVSWSSSTCPGQDRGLTTTHVLLNYNYTYADPPFTSSCSLTIINNGGGIMTANYSLEYPTDIRNNLSTSTPESASYLFEQFEHGGRDCNYLEIYFDNECSDNDRKFTLRSNNANEPRRKLVQWPFPSNHLDEEEVCISGKQLPFNLKCHNNLLYIEVSFLSIYDLNGCNKINNENQGVEFSVRISSMPNEWIPLQYEYFNNGAEQNKTTTVRGYMVNQRRVNKNSNTLIKICNLNLNDSVQFRWLQDDIHSDKDIWILNNVQISFNGTLLLSDNFNTSDLNSRIWPDKHVRNLYLQAECGQQSGLYFGSEESDHVKVSRSLLTNSFTLSAFSKRFEREIESNNSICSLAVSAVSSSEEVEFSSTIMPPSTSSDSEKSTVSSHFYQTVSTVSIMLTSYYSSNPTSTNNFINSEATSTPLVNPTTTHLRIDTATIESSKISPTTTNAAYSEVVQSFYYSEDIITTTAFEPQPSSISSTSLELFISKQITLSSSLEHLHIPSSTLEGQDTSTMMPLSTSMTTLTGFQEISTPSPKSDEEYILESEQELLKEIMSKNILRKIYINTKPAESVELLLNLTTMKTDNILLPAFLLGHITTNLDSMKFTEKVLQDVADIAINILQDQPLNTSSRDGHVVGITVLTSLDNLQFNYLPENYSFVTPNIILQNSLVELSREEHQIATINTIDLDQQVGPLRSLSLSQEVLQQFDTDDDVPIRIVSGVYKNVTHLFTHELNSSSRLGPDIISSSLVCGDEGCPTSELSWNSSYVTITFEHSEEVQKLLKNNNLDVRCVFLDIPQLRLLTNATLRTGDLSSRGCSRNTTLSSSLKTVCDCNHLTHFAILLSPKPAAFSQEVEFSLTVIGYIGVFVSLIAMGLTIFTFVALNYRILVLSPYWAMSDHPKGLRTMMYDNMNYSLGTRLFGYNDNLLGSLNATASVHKSLRSMRNYIHVNLCINLSIAQIIFVVGIDKTGPSNDDVPIHCQVIAVLLHYFFLVSFMWMLMEGVVLYVALVRVFIKYTKRYILAFTVISYGAPLLYMGLLTLPLGFSLNIQSHYGYNGACFMNPDTGFMWAFIAPFIAIFLANVGFFIMAARIMWHHQSKQVEKKKVENFKSWLKSALSLVVIMSLTWIMGILIIEVHELVFLAYIYTIMVAFQGLFIFLIFVIFSKSVREAYVKYWKVKVSESEFLSKYFGENSNLTGTSYTSKIFFLKSSNGKHSSNDLQNKESSVIESSTPKMDETLNMSVVIENSYIAMHKHQQTCSTDERECNFISHEKKID